jgi:hypothetical protein
MMLSLKGQFEVAPLLAGHRETGNKVVGIDIEL